MKKTPAIVPSVFSLCMFFLALIYIPMVQAQVYEKVFSFTDARALAPSHVGSGYCSELLQANDGSFYGMIDDGGDGAADGNGSVIKISPIGILTTLVEFSGTSGNRLGRYPYAALVQDSNGDFYGTTSAGGTADFGTVFKMTPGGVLSTLVEFNGNSSGCFPYAALVQGSDGNFYGTTNQGGIHNFGTVFKISPAGILTTLVHFTGIAGTCKGRNPCAAMVLGRDGNFYGTTCQGGASDSGTVFRMTPSGALTTLVEFTGTAGDSKGSTLYASLVLGGDGDFYGTTYEGGGSNVGTVFKMSPAGVLTTLVEFTGDGMGSYPRAALVQDINGDFYGTTESGGASDYGTAFKMTPTGILTTLLSFTDTSGNNKGGWPRTALVHGGDGSFYGATLGTRSDDFGTVFKITPAGALTTIVEFSGSHIGNGPSALVEDFEGNFYGTTAAGGSGNHGTAFKITPAGVLTTLVEFTGMSGNSKGRHPYTELALGSDGNFYGTTYEGGADDWGTVFRMTPSGVLTTLVEFTGCEGAFNRGSHPNAALVQDGNGNFYGTTEHGGANNQGTVFKMTADGVLTTLVEFTGNSGNNLGGAPCAALVQGDDGNFYGTTSRGGAYGYSTVFRITPTGVLTTLVELTRTTVKNWGLNPRVTLMKGIDGIFYGTTQYGGAGDFGTVFKMTSTGELTTLVEFTGYQGAFNKGRDPVAALAQGSDGDFYGTTSCGGINVLGTVFKMTADGVLTTLVEFNASDKFPYTPLIRAADGTLYGTVVAPVGAIFRLLFPGPPLIFPRDPQVMGSSGAILQTSVNARGSATIITLEYGTDGSNFPNTVPVASQSASFLTKLVGTTLTNLVAGSTYYYRFRGVSSAGTTVSRVGNFSTLAAPVTIATPAGNILPGSVTFNGTVNARNYDASVIFQWGTDGNTFPSQVAATPGIVTGNSPVAVSAPVAGLVKGSTYLYRVVATNAAGTTVSGAVSFTTLTEPVATAGGASAVSTTRAQVNGWVNVSGATATVSFEYGTDGVNYPYSVAASTAAVTGSEDIAVSTTLTGLSQGTTYHYRVRATGPGGTGVSAERTFSLSILSGLVQSFPEPPPITNGAVTVRLVPASVGGWRLVGEQQWRTSNETAVALATGDRSLEFRPVPGYIQPPQETVSVVSGDGAVDLERAYYVTPSAGNGGITVTLKPDSLAAVSVSVATRAQWRLSGENDTQWRNSGVTLSGQPPGSYLIECKPVAGRTTPSIASVQVLGGQTVAPTITYVLADTTIGLPPSVLGFSDVSTNEDLPYAYVGQLRSNVGYSTGFVVKRRVVATAGHVVFDDGTLSAVTQLQWLFQLHRGKHEPKLQVPRGFYLSTGYAAQRGTDNSPGTSSPQAQNLDFAALYFLEEAGRGGYGGFLASDLDENEFMLSSADKILAGYAVNGISLSNQGKLHATPAMNITFQPAFERTWTTSAIRGVGGCSGGPLFVRQPNGNYFPAAIYLGGTGQTVVRAIDSAVVDLFRRAEVSGNGGDNNTGGGITHTSVSGALDPVQPGSLQVLIEPAAARAAGAGWRLKPEEAYRLSGAQKSGLSPGTYVLELPTMAGFPSPSQPEVVVTGGQLTTLTFTYGNTLSALESWRLARFGTSTNAGDAADSADPDHDGQSNLSEYAAGTNPNDAADLFKVLATARTGSTFTLTTYGKAGRTYALQRKTDLAAGSWSTVATLSPLVTDAPVTLTDLAAPAGNAFYRIQVAVP